jgi:hypothetical protein
MNKHDRFNEMLSTGRNILVGLNPKYEDARVPEEFLKQEEMWLIVGLNTRVPIPDLSVSYSGFTATLSFKRCGKRCVIPWQSVFALKFEGEKNGWAWAIDGAPATPEPAPAAQTKSRGHLRLVK